MPTARHVEQLFSAAVDEELSPAQEQTFHDHLRQCSECSASYETFTEAIGKVRSLPKAAMPLPVHLPTGAPLAERATAADWLRRLIPRRFPMGMATGVAGLAAVAIVVVGLTRGSAPTQGSSSTLSHAGKNSNAPQAAGGQGQSCLGAATAGTAPSFGYRTSASDRSRPGQQLVLSASEATASAGSTVQIYAALTIPAQAAGAPGAAAPAATTSVTPCLSVTGLPGAAAAAPNVRAAPGSIDQDQVSLNANGADSLTIPPGTTSGTVVHVIATIPANYPNASQAPLRATLDITVR